MQQSATNHVFWETSYINTTCQPAPKITRKEPTANLFRTEPVIILFVIISKSHSYPNIQWKIIKAHSSPESSLLLYSTIYVSKLLVALNRALLC